MHALYRLNVCGMHCTSYYIGLLKLVVRMLLCFPTEGLLLCLSFSATPHDGYLLSNFILTDRPHKVNDRPHEVTDWPHQACVGAFELFDTINTPYFTHLCSRPQIKWVRSLVPRPPPSFFAILGTRRLVDVNTCLESAYVRSLAYPSGWPYQNGGQYQC